MIETTANTVSRHRPMFRSWRNYPIPTCWSVNTVHFRVQEAGARNLKMFSDEGLFIGLMEGREMYMVWDTMSSELKCDIYRMS